MHHRRISLWILLAVIAVSFAVHALSFMLPSVPASRQDMYRDEEGEPYLTEMDSYFYLRLAETMAEEGRILAFDQRLRGGRPTESTHVSGNPILLSTLTFCIWKFLSLFSSVTVIQAARWIAPLFASLAAIPAFLYVRKRTHLIGAAVAAAFSALSIPFVAHTFSGFFDTDCLLAVIPLGFVTTHLAAMQEERFRRQVFISLLSGLLFGILSMIWTAYYTYFWLMVLGGLISAALLFLIPFRCPYSRRFRAIRGFGMTIAFSVLFLFFFRSGTGVAALGNIFSIFGSISGTSSSSSFPFAHQYTDEMQPLAGLPDLSNYGIQVLLKGGTDSVLSQAGGLIPCLLAVLWLPLGILLPLMNRKKDPDRRTWPDMIPFLTEAGILPLWLLAGLKLALDSRRFTEIVVLPLALLAGLAVGFLIERMQKHAVPYRKILAFVLALCTCAATVSAAVNISMNNIPSVSDPKAQAMAWIRNNEPENATVVSWWDDGYFMEYAARRRVPADGGTSDGTVYYFLGRALMTDDPAIMTGLLRMLETSSVQAVSMLRSKGFSDAKTADLLCRIAALTRDDSDLLLSRETMLSPEERVDLLDLTHPAETMPLLLCLSSDLLEKVQVLAWYGTLNLETKKQEMIPYIHYSKASQPIVRNGICRFEMAGLGNPIQVRIGDDGMPELMDDLPRNLSSFSLWKNGECVLDQELPGYGGCLILLEENERLYALNCSRELKQSMLIRLFVCGEKGIPGIEQIGTWYGDTSGDVCRSQSLITYKDQGTWGVRLWRLAEYNETP